MKIVIYSERADESAFVQKFGKQYGVELILCHEGPSSQNVHLAEGASCISIITTPIDEKLARAFYDKGVRFISTRTIGYDHIDCDAVKKLGMHVGNVSYSVNSVADYTIMMMMMAARNMGAILSRSAVQDYSLPGFRGRELPNLTVGVIGTGRIGRTVIKHLSGFGCPVLAYDLYESDEVRQYARYVPLDELISTSDLITLHMPATDDNYHMINADTLAAMKDGVIIVNTARGSLIDSDAFISAIESGKVGAAALDVVENEAELYYNDLKCKVMKNRELAMLRSFPNVIVTPHMAFYTAQAVSDMVENSIKSCVAFMQGGRDPHQIF